VRHAIHLEADAEFAEAVRYYGEIAPDLGARFYREMERLIRDACAHPERFRKVGERARRHISVEFPYAVITWNSLIASGSWQ
jgi:hypothetical protein